MRRGAVGAAVVAGSLAALAAAAGPLAAQGEKVVDSGRLELRVDGRTVGTERFEIRRSGRQFRAAGRVTLDSAVAGLRPLEILLETDAGHAPELFRLRPTAGDVRSVTAVREEGRLRVQVSSRAGDRWKEFVAPDGLVLVEPGAAHIWALILLRHRDRLAGSAMIEVPAVVPSEARTAPLRLRREGPDRADVPGANRDAVRYTATLDGSREFLIWTSEEGHVLRVESPGTGIVAVRVDGP
jgi:hypothetical protein